MRLKRGDLDDPRCDRSSVVIVGSTSRIIHIIDVYPNMTLRLLLLLTAAAVGGCRRGKGDGNVTSVMIDSNGRSFSTWSCGVSVLCQSRRGSGRGSRRGRIGQLDICGRGRALRGAGV